MRSTQVTFRMPRERERAFLAAYMIDAWDRFEFHDAVESAWFWRFGATADHEPIELEGGEVVDGGGVILVLNGTPDPTSALDPERDRWRGLESRGLLDAWAVEGFRSESAYDNAREKMIDKYGERGGELTYRLRPLAARTTLGLLEAFDEDLPPVGDPTEDNPVPIGQWVLIHYLMKQSGHDWYGEIDAARRTIRNRLRSLAAFHGASTAVDELETVIDELDGLRDELAAGGV